MKRGMMVALCLAFALSGFMGGAELQYGISDMYKIPCKKPGQRSKIWLIHFDIILTPILWNFRT